VTELAKNCGKGIEWLCPWNDAAKQTTELLPVKTTT
jgi:hypothetical protein